MGGALLAVLFAGAGNLGVVDAAGEARAIAGIRFASDGSSRIVATGAQGARSGRIVWLAEAALPANNPEGMASEPKTGHLDPAPARRGHPLPELTALAGLHYAGNAAREGGTIHAHATGKPCPCQATVAANSDLELHVGTSVPGRKPASKRITPAC